ncbi:MAG: hypothetical protein RLY87_2139 [Chloroflexota bacterium]
MSCTHAVSALHQQLIQALERIATQMRVARLVIPTVTRALAASAHLEVALGCATSSPKEGALGHGHRRIVRHARDVVYWWTVVRDTDMVQRSMVAPVLEIGVHVIDALGADAQRVLQEDAMPRDTAMQIQSFGLAVQVVTIAQQLTPSPQNVAIVEGFVRSGTRIGAYIERAMVEGGPLAQSADIVAAVDCIHETLYWLRVLEVSHLVTVPVTEPLYADCEVLLGLIEQTCARPAGLMYRPDYAMVTG